MHLPHPGRSQAGQRRPHQGLPDAPPPVERPDPQTGNPPTPFRSLAHGPDKAEHFPALSFLYGYQKQPAPLCFPEVAGVVLSQEKPQRLYRFAPKGLAEKLLTKSVDCDIL